MHVELETRLAHLRSIIGALLTSDGLLFDRTIHSRLPERHGIYRIYRDDAFQFDARASVTHHGRLLLRQGALPGERPDPVSGKLSLRELPPGRRRARCQRGF